MTSGLKHVLIAQIRALARISYAIFHIVCPFHIVHLFFIFLFDNFSNFKAFVYISFIFPTNDAFFSFIQQFIQFCKENNSFNKLFIQKNMKLFIQRNYSFIWKMDYRPGLPALSRTQAPEIWPSVFNSTNTSLNHARKKALIVNTGHPGFLVSGQSSKYQQG